MFRELQIYYKIIEKHWKDMDSKKLFFKNIETNSERRKVYILAGMFDLSFRVINNIDILLTKKSSSKLVLIKCEEKTLEKIPQYFLV